MIRSIVVTALFALMVGCARATQFDHYYANAQWVEAARAFAADSTLATNQHELYRAALLYSTPGRPTYDATKGRELLQRLLATFPTTSHRDDAETRLLLLSDMLRTREDAARLERELENRVTDLTRQVQALRARGDSAIAQNDSLRTAMGRLDAERREREEQLKALRLELQQLKEIDLKPKRPIKP
jgi:Trp operon repressor